MSLDITAANAVFMLSIANLYPVPQQLQGFMAEDVFDVEDVEPTENVMGVDGFMSTGFVPFMTKQTVSIMPSSPSYSMFEDWLAAMKAGKSAQYAASGIIELSSTGRSYTLTNGQLSRIKQVPAAKKVLQGTPFQITWQDISPVNI